MTRNCERGAAVDFEALVGRIQTASDALRQDALVVINRSVTARAWLTGYYIVEYEQHGKDRAEYGTELLRALSTRLGKAHYSVPSLKKFRQFYKVYPELASPIAQYLQDRFGKGQSPIIQLPLSEERKGYSAIIQSENNQNTDESCEDIKISPFVLFGRLSYTHIVELLHLDDDLQRTFYAFEAIRGTWSVRELQRQIDSNYYVRCGWSKDPSKLSALVRGKADKATLRETLRSPHVFEFFELAAKSVIEESDVEQAIIDHLQEFIMEMGRGFCWEARQKKILIDDRYEWVDLVFYHRILKCHVLIELKARRFNYADAAQLGVYMAYYRKHEMQTDDNPPIGILLCTEAGHEMVEYVNTLVSPDLFVSKYQLKLPTKDEITAFLKRENGTAADERGRGAVDRNLLPEDGEERSSEQNLK